MRGLDHWMTEYSVVIPSFNRSDLLPRAIGSVLAQTRPPLEIIIVDDASTDNTAGISERFPGAPLRVVRHAENRGPSAARNTGVEAARAPWVAFLDSDDEWAPVKAERQLRALLAGRGGAPAGVTGFTIQDLRVGRTKTFRPGAGLVSRDALLFGCALSPGSTMIVDRTTFLATGGFDPALRRHEDWDWMMRYQRSHALAAIPDVLTTQYRFNIPNQTHVAFAVAHLRAAHAADWREKSWVAGRKFASSLDVEEAAGAYFERDRRKAVGLTLRAIATYPLRGLSFYSMLGHRLLQAYGLLAEPDTARPIRARPRSIIYVTTDLRTGGAQAMLAQLAAARPSLADEVTVVSLLPGNSYADRLRAAGVTVVELGFNRALGIVPGLFRLARLIARGQPDLVQGWMYHGDLAAFIALCLSGRRRQTRLVWSIRCSNMDFSRYSVHLRVVARACALLSGRPDVVTANSAAGMTEHERLGYHSRRSEIIYNGVDTSEFRPDAQARVEMRRELGLADDAFVVAHVARLDPMKDHENFLAAMKELPDLRALLIGTSTESINGGRNVHSLGRRGDVARLLAASDVIVSSSAFGEGFSNAVAEGMSSGLPAIATDVGDASVIVGDTGVIVPPRNSAALVDALRSLSAAPRTELHERGARARRRIADQFSIQRSWDRFAELYRSLKLPVIRDKTTG
jgi:glycosyltransferase involved in cell wall biosynthesis